MNSKIKLDKEEKEHIVSQIIEYFEKEKNEEIGNLAATLYLDFITENIAPYFYNQGVKDSIAFMSDKIDDMYSLEFITK